MPNFRTPTNEELNELYMTDTEELDQYISSFLWTWGHNNVGQLGTSNILHRSSPVQTIAGGTNWKKVSIGAQHMLAIKSDDTLWAWGYNSNGQLGNNSTVHRSSPVQTIAGGTNWAKVACGEGHTLAIKNDGTLWAWGRNVYGQLGNNSTVHRSSPVQTIAGGTNWAKVACGDDHTLAIKNDGTLWAWGHNEYGQLGNNSTVHRSSPVQTIAGGTNWAKVACGNDHTLAIKNDGTLWAWGRNSDGQLGDGTFTDRSSPVQIGTGQNWNKIAAGQTHSFGMKTDGTLWSWGNNSNGELGLNVGTSFNLPQQIPGKWKELCDMSMAFGGAAIRVDGTLWVWGHALYIGDNTLVGKSSPVQTALFGTNWKQVALGQNCAAAIPYTEI
jgi:alpha-tubulin suppressor-like RCC1 family protein